MSPWRAAAAGLIILLTITALTMWKICYNEHIEAGFSSYTAIMSCGG